MSAGLPDPRLPDSLVTWRFQAAGGDAWGGTLVADTGLHAAGDTMPGAAGTYTILAVEDRGLDLSAFGLEDRQVFVEYYWDAQSARFLATRNGPSLASGTAGLGSEQDFAWNGTAWVAFGLGGRQQADAARPPADARFTWVFEAHSGDRWGGLLFDLASAYQPGAVLQTAHGRYRITAEQPLAGGEAATAGSVRLIGGYFDHASGAAFAIAGADGLTEHGAAGLGSETGLAFNGSALAAFGEGGALQLDAPLSARPSLRQFGAEAGGWNSQNLFPRGAADVNGDGRADVVGFGNGGMLVAPGNGSGGFDPAYLAVGNFGLVAGGWQSQDLYPRSVVDVNGDGRDDIVGFGNAGAFVSLADGAGGFAPMQLVAGNFGFLAGSWTSQDRYPRAMGDVNGDGRADIVGFGNDGVWVSLAGEGGFGPMRLAVGQFGFVAGGWGSQDRYPRGVADINGDGLADVYGFGNAGLIVALADGAGGFGAPYLAVGNFGFIVGSWISQDRFPRLVADVNGDGRADVVGFGNAGVWLSLNDGAGGFGPMRLALAAYGFEAGSWLSQDLFPRTVADVNGDGRGDVIGFGNAGVWVDTGLIF